LDVCNELFPLLNEHARVVHVSSAAGQLSRIRGQEPQAEELRKKFSAPDATVDQIKELANQFVKLAKDETHFAAGWPNSTYEVSKVCVCAVTRIQQRTFDAERPGDDIVVNSVHPGYVDTDMTSHKGHLSIDEGAVSSVYAALLPPNVESPRGGFIWVNKETVDWVKGSPPTQY